MGSATPGDRFDTAARGNESGADYFAFLSYSHHDKRLAKRLHRTLERYRVPRRLVDRPAEAGVVSRRLRPIFRDDEELSAGQDLTPALREALGASGRLIVLGSPAAAHSRWVEEEVSSFVDARDRSKVFSYLVAGDKDQRPDELLPPSLRSSSSTDRLSADGRAGNDKREARLRLIAGLIGVPFDELNRREARRRRSNMTAVIAALTMLVVVLSGLSLLAVRNAQRADRNAALAEEQADVAFGQNAALRAIDGANGRNDRALLLAVAAHRLSPGPEAEDALLTSLAEFADLQRFLKTGLPPILQVEQAGGSHPVLVVHRNGTVTSFDLDGAEGDSVQAIAGDDVRFSTWSEATRQLAVANAQAMTILGVGLDGQLQVERRVDMADDITGLLATGDGRVLVGTFPAQLSWVGMATGEIEREHEFATREVELDGETVEVRDRRVESMALAADGRTLALGVSLAARVASFVEIYDSTDMRLTHRLPVGRLQGFPTSIGFRATGSHLFAGSSNGALLWWRIEGNEYQPLDAEVGRHTADITSVTSRLVTTGRIERELFFTSSNDGRLIGLLREPETGNVERFFLGGQGGPIGGVAVLDEANLVAGSDAGTLALWTPAEPRDLTSWIGPEVEEGDMVTAAAHTSSAGLVAIGYEGRATEVYATDDLSGEPVLTIPADHRPAELGFSPSGDILAQAISVGGVGLDTVQLIGVDSGEPIGELTEMLGDRTLVAGLEFAADDTVLLATATSLLRFDRVADRWIASEFPSSPPGGGGDEGSAVLIDMEVSPAGDLVAVSRTDGVLDVFDVERLELLTTITTNDGSFGGLAIRGDGRELAVVEGNLGAISRYDLRSGELLGEGIVTRAATFDLAYDSRGAWILAVHGDGVQLYSVESGLTVGNRLAGDIGPFVSKSDGDFVLLSSWEIVRLDGDRFVVAYDRRRAYELRIDVPRLVQEACRVADRDFTEDEWNRFFDGRRVDGLCS